MCKTLVNKISHDVYDYERSSYTIADVYKDYLTEEKNFSDFMPFHTFRAILVDYFTWVRNSVLEEGREFIIPFRLGKWFISRSKAKASEEKYRIDFGETRKLGKTVYHLNEHTNGYNYVWSWDRTMCKNYTINAYRFIPTRYNKRRLCDILKNQERDYITIR